MRLHAITAALIALICFLPASVLAAGEARASADALLREKGEELIDLANELRRLGFLSAGSVEAMEDVMAKGRSSSVLHDAVLSDLKERVHAASDEPDFGDRLVALSAALPAAAIRSSAWAPPFDVKRVEDLPGDNPNRSKGVCAVKCWLLFVFCEAGCYSLCAEFFWWPPAVAACVALCVWVCFQSFMECLDVCKQQGDIAIDRRRALDEALTWAHLLEGAALQAASFAPSPASRGLP